MIPLRLPRAFALSFAAEFFSCCSVLANVAFSCRRACLPVFALLPSHSTLNAKGRNASVTVSYNAWFGGTMSVDFHIPSAVT